MKIIDVRSKAEYDAEHIEGALWFDVDRIVSGEVPDIDRDEELVLYCRSGARSSAAALVLNEKGFTNVRSGGGLAQMVTQGHKIARPAA
jgi:phage shock protein E